MVSIVRTLRTFSRPATGEPQQIDADGEVATAVEMARAEVERRARLALDLEPLPFIQARPGELAQVVFSLLSNAAQAIPEGAAPENEVRVVGRVEGGSLIALEVSDTGRGVATEALDHLFEPFFTTRPTGEGRGLGLAVARSIVTHLGGTIEVKGRPGHGTVVRVTIPAPRT